jgi:hypothetical protein
VKPPELKSQNNPISATKATCVTLNAQVEFGAYEFGLGAYINANGE